VGQKSEGKSTREKIAENSPDSHSQIQRYIRLNELSPGLVNMVDEGKIAMRPAVELSYLSEETQKLVSEQAADFKIDMKKSKQLHQAADSEGNVDTAAAVRIISGTADVKPKVNVFKINRSRIEHFFEADTPQEEIENIIERALTAYFGEQTQF
jgi:ParB family chromosome partitioning protein